MTFWEAVQKEDYYFLLRVEQKMLILHKKETEIWKMKLSKVSNGIFWEMSKVRTLQTSSQSKDQFSSEFQHLNTVWSCTYFYFLPNLYNQIRFTKVFIQIISSPSLTGIPSPLVRLIWISHACRPTKWVKR